MSRIVLHGRLRPGAPLDEELTTLGVDGPVAIVTAGWEEAERNDAELDRMLGGGTRNLGLYGRRLDVLESDAEYADAHETHRLQRAEAQALYRIRVLHALAAVRAITRRYTGTRRVAGHEMDEAIHMVKAIDERHADAVATADAVFAEAHPPERHDVLAAHRAQVADLVGECGAIAVAGGHVAVLLECLRMFGIDACAAGRPLVCWSSACLAVSERVFVIHDNDPAERPAELLGPGLGLVRGVLPVPDAAVRLREDPDRLALLARRVAPRACLLLDEDDRVECTDGGPELAGARLLGPDGGVRTAAEAA